MAKKSTKNKAADTATEENKTIDTPVVDTTVESGNTDSTVDAGKVEGKGDEPSGEVVESGTPAAASGDVTTTTAIVDKDEEGPGPLDEVADQTVGERLGLNLPEDAAIVEILSYVEAMQPNCRQNDMTAAAQQGRLWTALTHVVKGYEGEKFHKAFADILAIFADNQKTCFSERLMLRGFTQVNITKGDRRLFEDLLTLLVNTSDVKGRPLALKNIDLAKAVEPFGEAIKQKIASFYKK